MGGLIAGKVAVGGVTGPGKVVAGGVTGAGKMFAGGALGGHTGGVTGNRGPGIAGPGAEGPGIAGISPPVALGIQIICPGKIRSGLVI